MAIKVLKKYYINDIVEPSKYQGIYILWIANKKHNGIKWFTDCGEWFLIIAFKKFIIRLSGAGSYFMKQNGEIRSFGVKRKT